LDCNHLKIFISKTRNSIGLRVFFSPDRNGNPLLKKRLIFSYKKRATSGSSFIYLEKYFFFSKD